MLSQQDVITKDDLPSIEIQIQHIVRVRDKSSVKRKASLSIYASSPSCQALPNLPLSRQAAYYSRSDLQCAAKQRSNYFPLKFLKHPFSDPDLADTFSTQGG